MNLKSCRNSIAISDNNFNNFRKIRNLLKYKKIGIQVKNRFPCYFCCTFLWPVGYTCWKTLYPFFFFKALFFCIGVYVSFSTQIIGNWKPNYLRWASCLIFSHFASLSLVCRIDSPTNLLSSAWISYTVQGTGRTDANRLFLYIISTEKLLYWTHFFPRQSKFLLIFMKFRNKSDNWKSFLNNYCC